MSTYIRSNVIPGTSVILRVIFTDANGDTVDLDALPDVYLYDASVLEDAVALEVETAGPYTGEGPYTPTRISKGFYEYEYSVATNSVGGEWHDVWVGAFNSNDATQFLYFTVADEILLGEQGIAQNEFIVVDLDASIADITDGTTLGGDVPLSFTTKYNPFYASVDMVRMTVGSVLDIIPDDTLAMMIHWSSVEAKTIATMPVKGKLFDLAKAKFVIFDASLRACMLPGLNSNGVGGNSKTLGDLSIKTASTASGVGVLSSGIDLETLKWFRDQRDEWWRVVNAGGTIVPGQSLDPEFVKQGIYDPDRYVSGRGWDDPSLYAYTQPGANTKSVNPGHRRASFGYDKGLAKYRNRSQW
jgi:hypothetical protein